MRDCYILALKCLRHEVFQNLRYHFTWDGLMIWTNNQFEYGSSLDCEKSARLRITRRCTISFCSSVEHCHDIGKFSGRDEPPHFEGAHRDNEQPVHAALPPSSTHFLKVAVSNINLPPTFSAPGTFLLECI